MAQSKSNHRMGNVFVERKCERRANAVAKGDERRKTNAVASAEKFSLEFTGGRRVFTGSAAARKIKRVGKRTSEKSPNEV